MLSIKSVAATTARSLVGITFLFSGFVKAVDPLGSLYKFQDYLTAMGFAGRIDDVYLLVAAVFLSTLEMALGACLLLAIARRLSSVIAVGFMIVMTAVTVWVYYADPVEDCGCFGDAIVLGNGATLLKNIALLALAVVAALFSQHGGRLFTRGNQWLLLQLAVAVPVALSVWCLYDLPLIDFRPYKTGTDIRAGMTVPEGAEEPEFSTVFILEKGGVRKEFSLENYPDSTWTFVDSRTEMVKEGYVAPIHDFSITSSDGEDITESVLTAKGYTFLLIAPDLRNADDQNFGAIDQVYEYCHDNGIPFICLTASDEKDIEYWKNITGAEYPFCFTDAVTLKTIIRSNPGLLMLKKGVVIGKWSHNRLPNPEKLGAMLR